MRRLRRILPMAFFILAVSAMPLMAGSKGDHGDDQKYGYQDKDKNVPEIDPSLAPTALALLSGGVLLLKSKSARK